MRTRQKRAFHLTGTPNGPLCTLERPRPGMT
jgi:hypothetical protein